MQILFFAIDRRVESDVFYCLPKVAEIQPLAELFMAKALKIRKRKGLIPFN